MAPHATKPQGAKYAQGNPLGGAESVEDAPANTKIAAADAAGRGPAPAPTSEASGKEACALASCFCMWAIDEKDIQASSASVFRGTLCKVLVVIYMMEQVIMLAPAGVSVDESSSALKDLANDILSGGTIGTVLSFDSVSRVEEPCAGEGASPDIPPCDFVAASPSDGLSPAPGALASVLDDLDLESAERSPHGTSGVYFISDRSKQGKVVFKPLSEESLSTGGQGFLKEVAAYVLDNGIAGVPETVVAQVDLHGSGQEVGSAQAYVAESEDAEDFGPGLFNVDDVHRIGVLDLRILNCDRHSGNLMRNKRTGKLVPIDHGLSFPSAFSDQLANVSFEWLQYPQAKQPFSPELVGLIEAINVSDDIDKLERLGIEEGAQLATWMSSTLLKLGAAQGLNLFEIGSLMQRKGDRSQPSDLEELFVAAMSGCEAESSPAAFFDIFSDLALKRVSRAARVA